MCPSYMVTRDEMHTTRGRANLLRLAMTGELPAEDDGLDNETLHEALDLCLQCKACKTECPSQVDMAKLKAEVLHQHYQDRPRPLSHLLLGQIFRLNPIAAATAPLTNRALRSPAFKWLLEKAAGIDRRRTLPTFARDHFRKWFRGHPVDLAPATRGSVVLLDDCFTTYNDPEVGVAAVRVLEAAGYRVELAGPGVLRPAGDLQGASSPGARAGRAPMFEKLAAFARRGIPIVGCEPSCLVTLVDEYRDFRLGPDAEQVATASRMVDAFVADPATVPDLPLAASSRPRAGSWPLPAKGGGRDGGHARRLAPGARARDQRARLGLLRHGRVVRLRARPLRSERSTGQSRLDPGGTRRPRGPAGRPGLFLPQPGARPGRDRGRASDRGFGRTARDSPAVDTHPAHGFRELGVPQPRLNRE